MTARGNLVVDVDETGDCLLVRPHGVLDLTTYSELRDTLLKCSVEAPAAIVVDLAALAIPSTSSLTVFTSAYVTTAEWPAVPIVLVAGDGEQRAWLRCTALNRFVRIVADRESAVAAARDRPRRRRATRSFAHGFAGGPSRAFVTETLSHWQVGDVVGDANLIVTELVENTSLHTDSDALVRLELRLGILTVAVSDDAPRHAVLRETAGGVRLVSGLRLVAQLAHAWGSVPTRSGGKVVWATLRTGRPIRDG